MSADVESVTVLCNWCECAIVRREILIGAPPGRGFVMWIGADPDDAGEVVELRNGSWRYLHPDQRQLSEKPRFRIHGSKSCGPESERDGG